MPRKLGIGCASIFALVIALSIISNVIGGGEESPETAPTATIAASATTVTERPSAATPVPPTPTPAPPTQAPPTHTPIPPSPTPAKLEMPAETRSYLTYVAGQLDTLVEASSSLSDLFTDLSDDPTLYLDDSWRIKVGVALGTFQYVGEEFQTYDQVPAEAEPVHVHLVAVGKELVSISKEYAAALDDIDVERMERTNERAEVIAELMGKANVAIKELQAKYE